ncbi:MAG: hypothetical protein JSR55_11200 [Proteobacteria bacterium]|nr:hypothetical protein [Pseudomonadota bacterium]
MTEYDDLKRATAREWAAARIVVIGGFALAIVVAGYFAWQRHEAAVAAQQKQAQQIAALAKAQQQRPAFRETTQDEKAKGAMLFCAMELVNAKNMGIVPSFGQLASPLPRKTDTQGRYACIAATQASEYVIEADLVCRQVNDPKCVHLHSIKTDDGTVLYQAKN